MTKRVDHLLNILSGCPDGMTADELVEFLRSHGENIKSTGRITGPLSNLHEEQQIFNVVGQKRKGLIVYFHHKFAHNYKPMDIVFKHKKIDDKKRCLDLYHDYVTTGNTHSLDLAERLYKELK